MTRNITLGILAGIGACMVWGTDFLAPQVLKNFSALEFSFGRSFFLGLTSLLFCRHAFAAFKKFTLKEKFHVFCLSAAGFWLYSWILFWSISYGNAIVTTLVIGTLPVTIALCSKKLSSLGKMFVFGIGLILAGLLTLHGASLKDALNSRLLTWLLPCTGLALWTWYGISNAAFVKKHKNLSKTDMVSMVGLITAATMITVGVFMVDIPKILHHEQFGMYVMWCAFMGIGNTWIGLWLWNMCALYCPRAVSGSLLVMETVFALLYTFIYQHRLPLPAEILAVLLFLAGAAVSVRTEMTKE